MSSTAVMRGSMKTVGETRRFPPGLKPRRKAFSVLTLVTFLAGVAFLYTQIWFFRAQPKATSNDVLTTRVSIPLKGAQQAPVAAAVSAEEEAPEGKCFKHILYDKPVKTGSTAIMYAMRKYLRADGRVDIPCGLHGAYACVQRALSICNGTVEEKDYFSVIGHLGFVTNELVHCLRPSHYVVTSVRDPYERRKSAYLWNRTINGTHFGIPHNASFSTFMNRLPRCQLYHYYDGRGMRCDVGVPLEQRLQNIVDRIDEVIDIYDEPAGPLHKRIAKYLARENESIKVKEEDFVEEFDRDTLKEETTLYERLRELRQRKPDVNRLPC